MFLLEAKHVNIMLMLYYNYTCRHSEVVRRIHFRVHLTYGVKVLAHMHSHSIREIVSNENIRVQNADYTLCDDMGWSGNKVPQKALKGYRDNRFYLGLHPDDRA
ncbi:hypothetical protein PAEPH01_1448 [Pancytospora epiphaga]|nr:hypothetical protein PAEPH01_1448 [Pancytospora epiphaga]